MFIRIFVQEIRQHAPQNAVLMLVGNKADLEGERKVAVDIAKHFESKLGLGRF